MRVLKKKYSTLISFLFLLLYIFVNSSFILFHHHEISVYKQSTFVNQNIFKVDKTDNSQSTKEFSTAKTHCFFCDHHTFSFHQLNNFTYSLIKGEVLSKTPIYYKSFNAFYLENSANKDPPINV